MPKQPKSKEKMQEPTLGMPLEDFTARLKDFCNRYDISTRALSKILGKRQFMSESSCYRLFRGTLQENLVVKILPTLEQTLDQYLTELGTPASIIENELAYLFPHRKDIFMIANRCELPASAVKFFNLKQDPFDVDRIPTDEELFTNEELDDIAARVRDAVLYKRFLAIVGGVGSGKTSLKIRVARELAASKHKIHLLYPEFFDMSAINVGSIARSILDEFEVGCPRDTNARVRRIKQLLTSLNNDGTRIALVFDECHRLNEKVVTSLKNFWEMTNGGYQRLLGIVLYGQPKFVEATLRDYRFKEIAERVQVVQMPPLDKAARDYLAHKIAAAEGKIDELFDERSVERICRLAKTPLALGNLANEALLEAYKVREPRVVSSMLKLPDMPKTAGLRKVS